ncbi:6-bladed beta-propeller [Sphingobacterium griseoflavum]|uniref:6-bladed beta-propeller n=1 Tax=Sphingobacterium griseoflavum TaxID=1474952 RepID=A0ABQ3HV24_9SPHI|nr:6-bladed beta-propeller [Sphingobacterium griseoflavum]GHE34207.1 hypothetical protein GCM10017764_16920 [Sphingobacterium griseoflavum]
MNNAILSIIILIIFICHTDLLIGQESVVENSNIRQLRIDPDIANGGSMDQVFSEINYIPLETTKESLFGDITQLEVTIDNYIIFDQDTQCILIFDKSGKYKSKIALGKYAQGGNLNESNFNVYGFVLRSIKDDYTIEVTINNNVYKFDSSLKQVGQPKQIEIRQAPSRAYRFSDSLKIVSYFRSSKGKDRGFYHYAYLNSDQVTAKYFEIDTGKYSKVGDFAVGGPSFIETDDSEILHAVRYYDYNVYQINKNGIAVAYKLIFPSKYSIPVDFNTNAEYLGKKIDYFFKNPAKIFGIGYTYQIGNFLYFKCGSLHPNIRNNGSFVYDLAHDYLISLNRLDPDKLSHHLPIIGSWDKDFLKYDGTYLYATLSSKEMFSYYDQVKQNNLTFPQHMKDYFKKGSKKDNPVLIQFTPKKEH